MQKASASHLHQKFWFSRKSVVLAFLCVRFHFKLSLIIIKIEGAAFYNSPLIFILSDHFELSLCTCQDLFPPGRKVGIGDDQIHIRDVRKVVGLYQPELAGIRQNDVLGRGFNHNLFVLHDVGVDAGDAQTLVDPRHREKGLVGPVAADELHSLRGSKVIILGVVVAAGKNDLDIRVFEQFSQDEEVVAEHRILKIRGQVERHP